MKTAVGQYFAKIFVLSGTSNSNLVASATPSSNVQVQNQLAKLNQDLHQITKSLSDSGTHWGVIAAGFISVIIGGLTLLLFLWQSKTMKAQTAIMSQQNSINAQLVSIENSREKQANYVYAYVKAEVNYKAFKGNDEIKLPFEEAVSFKLKVVNDSKLPIKDVWVLIRPVYKRVRVPIKESLAESSDGAESHESNEPVKTVLVEANAEDNLANSRYMLFGVVAPHTRKTFFVDSSFVCEKSALITDPPRLFNKQRAEFSIGLADGQFLAAIRFQDIKGHEIARDFGGDLFFGSEIVQKIPEFRIMAHLPGKHLAGEYVQE